MYSVRTVASQEEYDQALADGWHPDQYAAKAAHEASQVIDVPMVEVVSERERLENKARAMGIKFDGRTSDRRLAELIAAKTSEQAAA